MSQIEAMHLGLAARYIRYSSVVCCEIAYTVTQTRRNLGPLVCDELIDYIQISVVFLVL